MWGNGKPGGAELKALNLHVFNWKTNASKPGEYLPWPLEDGRDRWRSYLQSAMEFVTEDCYCYLEFIPGDTLEQLSLDYRTLERLVNEVQS